MAKPQKPIKLTREQVEELLMSGKLHERHPTDTDFQKIRPLLKRLSDQEPMYLTPKPFTGATPKDCWLNVKAYIADTGGEPRPGWLVLCQDFLYYLKCVPHVVVIAEGQLLDVTPPEKGERILFVPDSRITIESKGKIIAVATKRKAQPIIAAARQVLQFEYDYLVQHNDNPVSEYVNLDDLGF
jgi:hypothetical protein